MNVEVNDVIQLKISDVIKSILFGAYESKWENYHFGRISNMTSKKWFMEFVFFSESKSGVGASGIKNETELVCKCVWPCVSPCELVWACVNVCLCVWACEGVWGRAQVCLRATARALFLECSCQIVTNMMMHLENDDDKVKK